MKSRRPSVHKIPDIKALRALIRILGMFHISGCWATTQETNYTYDGRGLLIGQYTADKEVYGIGLRDSKNYVESKFDYYIPADETTEDKKRVVSMIQKIKQLRQFMFMLNRKFHIQSADSSLKSCKLFVDRHPR